MFVFSIVYRSSRCACFAPVKSFDHFARPQLPHRGAPVASKFTFARQAAAIHPKKGNYRGIGRTI